ncbi:hypothetical protein [Clostridium beijerinckii]|uniref:hypothetical protein n=1 Tax=Clostridium beijerinckii TaxID=1520 RepID=UPI000A557C47|nr:hypothetical protein [Clostridium beijerinckii]
MEKVIDGKSYKEVKINKIIVNGKEISGSIIPAEDATEDNDMTVTIFTENANEEK